MTGEHASIQRVPLLQSEVDVEQFIDIIIHGRAAMRGIEAGGDFPIRQHHQHGLTRGVSRHRVGLISADFDPKTTKAGTQNAGIGAHSLPL